MLLLGPPSCRILRPPLFPFLTWPCGQLCPKSAPCADPKGFSSSPAPLEAPRKWVTLPRVWDFQCPAHPFPSRAGKQQDPFSEKKPHVNHLFSLYSSSSTHLRPHLSDFCRQASWALYRFSFQDFLFFNTYLFGCIGSSLRLVNSWLQHMGSSSLSRDHRTGRLESWPLDHQWSPSQTLLDHRPWSVLFSITLSSWKSGALTLKTLVPPMSFKSPFWNGWFLGLLIPKPVPFTAV